MILSRRWPLILLLSSLSCTIIEEDDITSPAEASQVTVRSVKVTQKTSKGSGSFEIKLLYDSVQNFTDAVTGTKITRKVAYSFPGPGSLKLKMRSGSTQPNSFYIYYTEFKRPYTLGVMEKDSVIELYRFRYNGARQVNRVITIIDPIDNKPPLVFTRDTLVYGSVPGNSTSGITKLTRKGTGSPVDYDVSYQTHEQVRYVVQFKRSGSQSNESFQQSGDGNQCRDGGSQACAEYQWQGQQQTCGNCSFPSIMVSGVQIEDALVSLDLRDVRIANGSAPRDADTFYFHPLMILRGQLPEGQHLLVIYLQDWWKLGATVTNSTVSSEDVIFDFAY